jgi:hypothetical protein
LKVNFISFMRVFKGQVSVELALRVSVQDT